MKFIAGVIKVLDKIKRVILFIKAIDAAADAAKVVLKDVEANEVEDQVGEIIK